MAWTGEGKLNSVAILIPAYRPSPAITDIVSQLAARHAGPILVVDDGSRDEFADTFCAVAAIPGVIVAANATNLGKGGALKSGINRLLVANSDLSGVVTADADGQHSVDDILKVVATLAEDPTKLVLGAREFGSVVPFRSKVGNGISRVLYRLLLGLHLRDTQTGLRGLPRHLALSSLHIRSTRYEFETEQLALAAQMHVDVAEVPIQTIYLDDNASSHFDPFFDSLRIYFVVLRYALSSMATAAVDFAAFIMLAAIIPDVIWANLASRTVALGVQFALLRSFVFHSEGGSVRFVLFVAYVMATGVASGALQGQLREWTLVDPITAKVLVETLIFVFNFLFLRDILFRKRR